MRVIAGEKRHLLLKTLDDLSIRPTTDKIKETLFNIIQFKIPGANFLDVFAGSGAIGIEALSRGANLATFIDCDANAIKVIKENLLHTKLDLKAKVLRGDAERVVDSLSKDKVQYDIVFLDPPYNKKLYYNVLVKLYHSDIINTNSLIILETSIKDDVNDVVNIGYNLKRVKEYKTNKHVFFVKGGTQI